MKKIIFIIIIILILVISAFIGYTAYFNTNKEAKSSDQPMSKTECENSGGQWSEMEVLKAEGHIYMYFCVCPKKILLPDTLIWLSEGEMKKCP